MSHNLKRCLEDLNDAMKIRNKRKRDTVIRFLRKRNCFYHCLREIALNINNGNIKIDKKHTRKMKPYEKTIKALARGVKSKNQKIALVHQTGGMIPWLIPLVTAALPAVIDLIKK